MRSVHNLLFFLLRRKDSEGHSTSQFGQQTGKDLVIGIDWLIMSLNIDFLKW